MALETKGQKILKYALAIFIPLIVFTLGTLIVYNSDKVTTVKNTGFARAGYPDVPTTYTITASPHKVYLDTWQRMGALIVLGWALAIGGPVAYYYIQNMRGKESGMIVTLALWLGGLLLAFGIFVTERGKMSYTKTLTEVEYNTNQTNLDSFFPKY